MAGKTGFGARVKKPDFSGFLTLTEKKILLLGAPSYVAAIT